MNRFKALFAAIIILVSLQGCQFVPLIETSQEALDREYRYHLNLCAAVSGLSWEHENSKSCAERAIRINRALGQYPERLVIGSSNGGEYHTYLVRKREQERVQDSVRVAALRNQARVTPLLDAQRAARQALKDTLSVVDSNRSSQ